MQWRNGASNQGHFPSDEAPPADLLALLEITKMKNPPITWTLGGNPNLPISIWSKIFAVESEKK